MIVTVSRDGLVTITLSEEVTFNLLSNHSNFETINFVEFSSVIFSDETYSLSP